MIDITELKEEPYKPLAEYSRKIAARGCVLLKNENNILPFLNGEKISLFGRTQINYNVSGIGSGGLVNVEYEVNILDGIKNNEKLALNEELVETYVKWIEEHPVEEAMGWAQKPWSELEFVPDDDVVKRASEQSDAAVIVLGRVAGEDRDNAAEKGSWYLTDEEESLLGVVSKYFEKTVVLLNVGNIIDMNWVEKYDIKSVMYIWQGGQEGGNAVADVLCGDIAPEGRLTDTIAKDISLYPSTKNFGDPDYNIYEEDIYVGYRYFETFAKDEVLYPFGFGLSYTSFERSLNSVLQTDDKIIVEYRVKNTGDYTGRDVIQVYYQAPQGLLGKSLRELCAFAKTKDLMPGEEEILVMEFLIEDMSSYDDSGITGNKSCYILENGVYNIYAGDNVRSAEKIHSLTVDETKVVKKYAEVLAPERDFDVLYPVYNGDKYDIGLRPVSKRTIDYNERIKAQMPEEIPYTGDKGIKLEDVINERKTLDEFVAQLSDIDLMCLSRGEGMQSPKVRPGSAGAVGGLTQTLKDFGVSIVALHDGPSGIRMDNGDLATSMPNGTLLACTWDTESIKQLYEYLSVELCTHKIDSILCPGINIHRSPLNGRNFEYFSEDPFLTGKVAAAVIRGVNKYGNSATVKHFALNSQEYMRRDVNAVVSERAIREIYLKGFEMAIKEGKTTSLMTSYNPINERWSANNYELNTIVLRDEWGYDGFVVTDWWPKLLKEDSEVLNLKEMVEAQNDVYMPTQDALRNNDNLEQALKNGEITRAQLQRNAKNILRYIMKSHSQKRFIEFGGELEKSLAEDLENLDIWAVAENLQNDQEIKINLPETGRVLLGVEYESDEPEISQMVINVYLQKVSAASITLNGTSSKSVMVYRDISTAFKEVDFKITYPQEQIKINKIIIFGNNK